MPPLCPVRATLSRTRCHRCHPAQLGRRRFVPKAGWGLGMAPALRIPTVPGMASRGQSHRTHSHLLSMPVVTRPCWPFGMSPMGTRATGPSNQDDGGWEGGALCHRDLLIKARAFRVGFPISKWLQVALGHSLPWSDGCGGAENVLHSSHPWAGAVQQVLTLSQPQNQGSAG